MPEDASLDQFVSADADERDGDGESRAGERRADDADPDDSETTADPDDSAGAVAPAVSTYDWSPEDGECANCGRSVARRWRADGQRDGEFVCADCKQW